MRLFLAIGPDEAARCALEVTASRLRRQVRGRYVSADAYHLTIAFLGEKPPEAVPAIREAMRAGVRGIAPFPLALGGIGAFGPVLWRGVEKSAALERLARKARAALAQADIAFDTKPFRAHVTLAYHAGFLREMPALPGARFVVQKLILYESVRGAAGAVYVPRAEVLI